mmetsp:Transcript_28908/g.90509  ORF Transcript_28908/g.90509 Transcript_28908/m.90509 type:complete len:227 (+) Transcript_28908:518-1198(+)
MVEGQRRHARQGAHRLDKPCELGVADHLPRVILPAVEKDEPCNHQTAARRPALSAWLRPPGGVELGLTLLLVRRTPCGRHRRLACRHHARRRRARRHLARCDDIEVKVARRSLHRPVLGQRAAQRRDVREHLVAAQRRLLVVVAERGGPRPRAGHAVQLRHCELRWRRVAVDDVASECDQVRPLSVQHRGEELRRVPVRARTGASRHVFAGRGERVVVRVRHVHEP